MEPPDARDAMTPAECAAVAADFRSFARLVRGFRQYRDPERTLLELDDLAKAADTRAEAYVTGRARERRAPEHQRLPRDPSAVVSGRNIVQVAHRRRPFARAS